MLSYGIARGAESWAAIGALIGVGLCLTVGPTLRKHFQEQACKPHLDRMSEQKAKCEAILKSMEDQAEKRRK